MPTGPPPQMLTLLGYEKQALKMQLSDLVKAMNACDRGGNRLKKFDPMYTEHLQSLGKALNDIERAERQYREWQEKDMENATAEVQAGIFLDWLEQQDEVLVVDVVQKATRALNGRKVVA